MTRWTLLTAPGWVGQCPPMPGQHGPTYAKQVKVVSKWMAPAMRDFYEALRWKECPHMIFAMYLKATEYDRLIAGELRPGEQDQ